MSNFPIRNEIGIVPQINALVVKVLTINLVKKLSDIVECIIYYILC